MRELEILESAENGIVEHHSPFVEQVCIDLDVLMRRGLLEPMELGYYVLRYRVTEAGKAFIAKHAAPAEW